MKVYVMDSFSDRIFGGNQAGVVLADKALEPAVMQQVAAELKHSETAFVWQTEEGNRLRYFTPAGEVDLCGHATVAVFALLRRLGRIEDGTHKALTRAGALEIEVSGETVWMDMAPPKTLGILPEESWEELYEAYGLTLEDRPADLPPEIVSTGLADIMMPVRDHETLLRAVQDERTVTELSRRFDVTGVHMFCLGEEAVYCSNFAPLYDIPEECATGTSNGALTYYLYERSLVEPERENLFLQGEHMERPSRILSRLTVQDGAVRVRIGGQAVMSLAGEMDL
ncbi:MAG: PhzF family phenazine biosynthesis protein [Clostridiales bacterium]|nr:PhzF family phenazine biosynthesis protein [Clostridiales bacterium]